MSGRIEREPETPRQLVLIIDWTLVLFVVVVAVSVVLWRLM